MLDAKNEHLKTIKDILALLVPECEVRAFGSRVNGKPKDYSDLDLAVICGNKDQSKRIPRLKEAFEESDLPFRVDVLDWLKISDSFKKIINKNYSVIQKAQKPA